MRVTICARHVKSGVARGILGVYKWCSGGISVIGSRFSVFVAYGSNRIAFAISCTIHKLRDGLLGSQRGGLAQKLLEFGIGTFQADAVVLVGGGHVAGYGCVLMAFLVFLWSSVVRPSTEDGRRKDVIDRPTDHAWTTRMDCIYCEVSSSSRRQVDSQML